MSKAYPYRIELTEEIYKIVNECRNLEIPLKRKTICESCPLLGPCLECWTGADHENVDEQEED